MKKMNLTFFSSYQTRNRDIVLAYNILNPQQPIKAFQEYIEKTVTGYLTLSIQAIRGWEATQTVPNPQTKLPIKLNLKTQEKTTPINSKKTPSADAYNVTVELTDMEVSWLQKAINFFSQMAPELRKLNITKSVNMEERVDSLQELIEALVTASATQTIVEADLQQLHQARQTQKPFKQDTPT